VPAATRRLIDLGSRAPVIIPRWDGQLHPLRAVYARDACQAHLEAELNRGHLKLVRAIEALQPHVVSEAELRALDPQGRSFFNINSPDDLALARRLRPDG
jgi:molybdopterin-guanine dinucleotide biosynthesis protein A